MKKDDKKKIRNILRGKILLLKNRNTKAGSSFQVMKNVSLQYYDKTHLIIGNNVLLYENVRIFLDAENAVVEIGDNTFINDRSEIKCQSHVHIGKNCAISWDVTITDTDYHSIDGKPCCKPVNICDNVWIGCKAVILKGVTIGEGSVIAAGAVVNSDVPPHSLVGGVPSRILKENISWTK